MEQGNGIKTHYSYDPATRRLCRLQSGKALQGSNEACEVFSKDNSEGAVSAELKTLVESNRQGGYFGQFQNLNYAYDDVGNILGTANAVRLPPNRELGGPAWHGYSYDSLYRLKTAEGEFESRNGQLDRYTLGMEYDNIHNIRHKSQEHTVVRGDKVRQVRATSYDWDYRYKEDEHPQPHAPTTIGERSYFYDANGNQLGWDHDQNGTRRQILWDDENRIQKIGDPQNTLEFAYDDTGERVMKRGQHGMTVYVNQYFTVRNLALASKHVYAGTTRIATKVEPGEPVGYDAQGSATVAGGTTPGATEDEPSSEAEEPGLLDEAVSSVKELFGFSEENDHPGQGLANRSERANEVACNTQKNKHLNGGIAGGERGRAECGGGSSNNAGGNGNNGNTNNGNTDNNGSGSTGGGNTKPPYDYGGSFLYYYHPDHLGSTSYVTDDEGALYEHVQYFPFGETWVEEQANTIQRVPYRFTGKELDEETGLYYFGARYYDPRTSVWVSADPILGKYLPSGNKERDTKLPGMGGVFNSLNLGLYTYTQQNPVILKDPDGRAAGTLNKIWEATKANFVVGPIDAYQTALGKHKDFAVRQSNDFANKHTPVGKTSAAKVRRERMKNAVRHVAWQASLTMEEGVEDATELGRLHELGEEDSKDSFIDRHNNVIGRRIGENADSYSDIVQGIEDALSNGELITDWNDSRVPQNLPNFINGDSSQYGGADSSSSSGSESSSAGSSNSSDSSCSSSGGSC